MQPNTQDWIKSIQADAERLTKKRIQEDKDEQARLAAEENQAIAAADDNKKKA